MLETRITGNVTEIIINIRHEHFDDFMCHLDYTVVLAVHEDEEE